MAATYINFDGTASRLGGMVRGTVDNARNLQEDTNKVVKLMSAARDDVTDVDASFVTLGGLLGVSSAKARLIYNMVVAFQAVINKPAYDALVDNLG
jgi:hypothetical protein